MTNLDKRPSNRLLRRLEANYYELLDPFLSLGESPSGEILYHPGDPVETVYFPCGPTSVSLAVAADEDRDVDTILVGSEGAVGGVIGGGFLPAYSRIAVRTGGPLARLPVRKLNEAKHLSAELRRLSERYSDYVVAQLCQSAACNAAHSIEERAAKWILQIIEHTGSESVTLTHEELAGGRVQRSGVGGSEAARDARPT